MKNNLPNTVAIRQRNAGLTLIELIVSIVVGSVVAVGLVVQVNQAIRFAQSSRQEIQAAMLYQEKIEELSFLARQQNFASVVASSETPVTGLDEYDRTVTIVSAAANGTLAASKEVTVAISGNSSFYSDQPLFYSRTVTIYCTETPTECAGGL
ncbi:MAG: prepilin-type N-terminal cleavage/methylation domain-containing protein [Magnetococcales bacterium]|nr:prepilin-type N-terminal cleavage/methylation domain-containing protein [Magnetococcales bacterium]